MGQRLGEDDPKDGGAQSWGWDGPSGHPVHSRARQESLLTTSGLPSGYSASMCMPPLTECSLLPKVAIPFHSSVFSQV